MRDGLNADSLAEEHCVANAAWFQFNFPTSNVIDALKSGARLRRSLDARRKLLRFVLITLPGIPTRPSKATPVQCLWPRLGVPDGEAFCWSEVMDFGLAGVAVGRCELIRIKSKRLAANVCGKSS